MLAVVRRLGRLGSTAWLWVGLVAAVVAVARERDEARAALSKARESAETERIGGRVAIDFLNARIATLETAIRTLGKVLP